MYGYHIILGSVWILFFSVFKNLTFENCGIQISQFLLPVFARFLKQEVVLPDSYEPNEQ